MKVILLHEVHFSHQNTGTAEKNSFASHSKGFFIMLEWKSKWEAEGVILLGITMYNIGLYKLIKSIFVPNLVYKCTNVRMLNNNDFNKELIQRDQKVVTRVKEDSKPKDTQRI